MCRLNFFLPLITIGNPAKDIKLTLKCKKNTPAGLIRHSLTKSTYNNYVSCPKFQLLFFRDGHSACVIQDAMYIFGGYSEASFSYTPTVFRLDLNNYEWTLLKCEGSPPIYRDFHTATAIDNKMFVFGGRSDNSNDFTQTEIYSDRLVYLVRDFL